MYIVIVIIFKLLNLPILVVLFLPFLLAVSFLEFKSCFISSLRFPNSQSPSKLNIVFQGMWFMHLNFFPFFLFFIFLHFLGSQTPTTPSHFVFLNTCFLHLFGLCFVFVSSISCCCSSSSRAVCIGGFKPPLN